MLVVVQHTPFLFSLIMNLLRKFNERALTGPGLSLIAVAGDTAVYDGRTLSGITVTIGNTSIQDTMSGARKVRRASFTIPKTVLTTAPEIKKIMKYDGLSYEVDSVSGGSSTEPAWIIQCSAAVK